MLYKGLPIYQMEITSETDGVSAISLVEYPAIEKNFLLFSDEEKKKLLFSDEERHVISGPAMIPDLPIYRCDESGYEYFVVFTKETIEQSAQRFMRNGFQSNISLQHELPVDSVYVFESYLVDESKGISPKFITVPSGTWMVSMKVDDPNLWETLKNTDFLNGFSIETVNSITKMSSEIKKGWLEELLSGKF